MSEPETKSKLGLEDSTGGISAMRVVLVYGSGIIFSVWAVVAIIAALHGVYTIPDLPMQVSLTLTAIIGGKVFQRIFGEK